MNPLKAIFAILPFLLIYAFSYSQVADSLPQANRVKTQVDTIPDPDINAWVLDATEPIPINMEEIRKLIGYPRKMKDAGVEGQVVVRVLVDTSGYPTKHRFIKKVHPGLTGAIEPYIYNLRFIPAFQDGRKIKFWVNIPFKFVLLSSSSKSKKISQSESAYTTEFKQLNADFLSSLAYPEEALKKGKEGMVFVEIKSSRRGYMFHWVKKSPDKSLYKFANKVVSGLKFPSEAEARSTQYHILTLTFLILGDGNVKVAYSLNRK